MNDSPIDSDQSLTESLSARYRNQSGMEDESDFPLMNISEEQRLAASRALSRWLSENRE